MAKKKIPHTKNGSAFTDLILEIMRVGGRVREHGQLLTQPHGLTAARWPVLGAIEETPLTVSQISRRMGVSRQNVQTVVNSMRAEGLVELRENPDHVRASLVAITPAATKILLTLHSDQRVWANELGKSLTLPEMAACVATLTKLFDTLENNL
jgi:DNA-binding MarR family transcriptional regulator